MKNIRLKKIKKFSEALCNKQFFMGISVGEVATSETGIAVLNRNLDLLRVDKFFTNKEIDSFLQTFPGLYNSIICVSLPKDTSSLSTKWKQYEKNLHAYNLYEAAEDMTWTSRYSNRGSDLYDRLRLLNISVYRYNIHIAKMYMNLIPPFKKRSQPGCKYLQTVIKDYLSVNNLPNNLIPISALDAIIGAYTSWKLATDKEDVGYRFLEPFNDQQVAVAIKPNLRKICIEEIKTK